MLSKFTVIIYCFIYTTKSTFKTRLLNLSKIVGCISMIFSERGHGATVEQWVHWPSTLNSVV